MKKLCCVLVFVLTAVALPAWSAEQMMVGQMTPPPEIQYAEQPAPGAGASLLAAVSNLAYCPLRFAITLVTAEVGGFTGWMTGGDEAAARAVWASTDGQAYMRPEVLEGRERLRFGRWQ